MPQKWLVFIAVTLGVLLADQVTKFLVLEDRTYALDLQPTLGGKLATFYSAAPQAAEGLPHYTSKNPYIVSENFLKLAYAENPGAAFGMFRKLPESARGPLFHVVSIGAVVLIIYYFRKLTGAKEEIWAFIGFPLVLGGALGNYIDRLARSFVIDFLEAHWFPNGPTWPSFNVADSAICVGVGMLVIDALVRKEKKEKVVVAG